MDTSESEEYPSGAIRKKIENFIYAPFNQLKKLMHLTKDN